ncbi:MAG: metallophosphoesterase [Kiritimatiellae bacterium]|nr:metallophosphoesterase [Kiritimatiellia bacterium]
MVPLPPLFAAPPTVYAVGGAYVVCVPVTAECTMWVECAGTVSYDHANGILRSGRPVHLASVPRGVLDSARSYSVHLRPIVERKPYFTETGEVQSFETAFRPVEPRDGVLRLLNVPDTHSFVDGAVSAAERLGRTPDMLVLCGDIPEDCGSAERMTVPHLIAGRITGGEYPAVFARGNHDLRGVYAEQYADLTPTEGGRSYHEFRLGPVWGLVLDTGEDKRDDCREYGWTVCCEAFREEEERWLRETLARGAPADAKFRLVACHNPFAFRIHPPFDIEGPRWTRWCAMLAPLGFQAMVTGHLHECWLEAPGGEHDTYGAPCPVVCSSLLDRDAGTYTCGWVEIGEDGAVAVEFVDQDGKIRGREALPAPSAREP